MNIRRYGVHGTDNEVVNVDLIEHYVKDLKRLGPVGPALGKAVRIIRSAVADRRLSGMDVDDAETLFDEIRDIGPALDLVGRQVREADLGLRRLHHSFWWIPVTLTIPERYYGPLVEWASVGRTFDNMRNLLRTVGGDEGLEKDLDTYQLPLDHAQKAIQTTAWNGGRQFA